MGVAEFAVPVPKALLELLSAGGESAIREGGHETVTTRFRGPRVERAKTKPIYDVNPHDPDRVGADLAAADHEHRLLDSERQELKDRMRGWMEHARRAEWGGFVLSDSTPRLSTDVRDVAEWLREGESPSTGLPGRFVEALGPTQVAILNEYVDAAATPVLRWRPDRSALPMDMAQSRDWHADDDGT